MVTIHNGRVVLADRTINGYVSIENGLIASVGEGSPPPGGEQIDAKGRYVIPGVVDPETHLGTWGPVGEEARVESRAAAAAGVTTWGFQSASPMLAKEPLGPREALPPLFSEMIPEWLDVVGKTCMTNFYLMPILNTHEQIDEIPRLAEEWGITSYKYYLHMKHANAIAGRWAPLRKNESNKVASKWAPLGQMGFVDFDDSVVFRGLEAAAKLPNGIVSLHCENWEIVQVLEKREKESGATDVAAWNRRSPGLVEAGHVNHYAYYANAVGCPLYIQHITTAETLAMVKHWRQQGLKIQGQCGGCYLTLPEDAWKINPPLRSRETMEFLWEAIASGDIECTGSDHVAFYMSREEMDKGSVWDSISGFPSRVEALLPSLLTEGLSKGRISIERLVEILCANPSKAFGLYPRKGVIAPGADADIVIVDPDKKVVLDRDMVLSGVGWSLYEGWEFVGYPVMTMIGGRVAVEWPDDAPRPRIDDGVRGTYLRRDS